MKLRLDEIRRVLVVGSWAKEQITIEHLKRTSGREIFAYMDTRNPAIETAADGSAVGDFYGVDAIADYAGQIAADLVLVTTAAPLSHGLVDELQKRDIPAFGPHKASARLESDKAFARNLMEAACPSAVPPFRIFDDAGKAVRYAESLYWSVAVKPVGLTDGLGVQVWGDQLQTEAEVKDYIEAVCRERIGGAGAVIVEKKLVGEEFTVQALVFGDRIVPTPAVQDFKKLLPGEKGPNTASMGSYSDRTPHLPFMTPFHYQRALEIMRLTLSALWKRTRKAPKGFLYGQFMVTSEGVHLIEYNFRPGDPEWMNTMAVLRSPLLDAVVDLMNGGRPELEFDPKATVCKYIVPEGYPRVLNQVLDVTYDPEALERSGVGVYHSCGLDEEGRLNVGTERGIAFLCAADRIEEAHERVEEGIRTVEGSYFHRADIGTDKLVRRKVDRVREHRKAGIRFRRASEEDFMEVQGFISGCPPLEPYPQHQYRILLRYFGNVCFAAENGNRLVGFIAGLVSSALPGTYFLWQIGVSPGTRGTGLGKRLLRYAEHELAEEGVGRIEVTVDPMNDPSRKLFEAEGYRSMAWKEGNLVEVNGQAALKDFYRPGRHFLLYEKSLG